MKNIFWTFVLFIPIGLTITSCDSTGDQKTQIHSDTLKINVPDTISDLSTVKSFSPGISWFSQLVDSLFNQNKTTASTYEVDTMTAEMTDYRDTRTNLFTSDNVIVKEYKLKNTIVNVNIVEAVYPDDVSINKAFRQTRNESKNPLGLSGGNDFVIKSDKTIYWLMSYSSVRLSDHQAMKQLMTKAWNISIIQDSINWSTKKE